MDFRHFGNKLNRDCVWQICSHSGQKTLQTGLRPGQGAREEEEERSREGTRKERRTLKFEKGNTGSK